jgi:tetratricopeptide (TPR) repeat protein
MSARRRKTAPRPAASGAPRGAKRPARSFARSVLMPIAMLALAAGLAAVALQARRAGERAQPSLERMDPVAAYQQALHLSYQKRWRESLPYYQRALEGAPGREWRPHFNHGIVLNDLTLQFTTRAGQQVSATRSSAERARLANAALDEFWRAVQLAPDGATRAKILALRANMLVLWGFPWEAFSTFRAAQQADPTRTDMRDRGDQFLALMHDPTKFRFVQPDSSMRLAMP